MIIATERARRPEDYIIRMNRRDMPSHVSNCAYCVGNEAHTETVFAEPNEEAWAVCLVKNKFPALLPTLERTVSGGIMDRLFCGIIEDELKHNSRIIIKTQHFVSFIPFAAISPFHLWLMPLRHMPDFGKVTDDELTDLSAHVRRLLRKIPYGLDDPDYNLVVRSILERSSDARSFHWYLSVIPRVSQPAGFELGSGMFINASIPEKSAEFLTNINAG